MTGPQCPNCPATPIWRGHAATLYQVIDYWRCLMCCTDFETVIDLERPEPS